MELYTDLNLHSKNTYIDIVNKAFKRVFEKQVYNQLGLKESRVTSSE